jgi:hypothetical protein
MSAVNFTKNWAPRPNGLGTDESSDFSERWNTPNKIDKHTAAKAAFNATSYN